MAVAWAFPGQGSQRGDMAAGLFEKFPDVTAQADEVLGRPVRELAGDLRALGETRTLQPVMFTVNALHYLDLAAGGQPDFLAGHSLGEYSALFAAGAIGFAAGLRLVVRRAELMGGLRGGGMLAVIGLAEDAVRQVLASAGTPDVEIANHNSARQIVIAGPDEQVRTVAPLMREAGASKTKLLNVGVAAHSGHMAPAAAELGRALAAAAFAEPRVPVLSNVTARPHTPGRIPELLERQLCAPVQWRETMRYLIEHGVEELVEVGPGTVLTKLWTQARDETTKAAVWKPAAARVAPAPAERLGAAGFRERYGLRLACAVGASGIGANGARLVSALAGAGVLAFADGTVPYGAAAVRPGADAENPGVAEADQPLGPTAELVRFRFTGARRDRRGVATAARHVIARVAGLDAARAFLRPPDAATVEALVRSGGLTAAEADAARDLPVASDLAVASPAGWHGGGATVLQMLPAVRALARRSAAAVHVGVCGGVGTPEQAAVAFALGADFVLLTSVTLCAAESALTPAVKEHLAGLGPGDVCWAPNEHFALGARSEVVRRGTLFPARANHLVRLYRARAGPDPATVRQIEERYLGRPIDEVTAETDPRRRLNQAVRWYLRRAGAWRDGAPVRALDYRLPCGADLVAFNEEPVGRAAAQIAEHLMAGAAEIIGKGSGLSRPA